MAAVFMAAGAVAQVVTSRTHVKSKSETRWYVRAGMSINNMSGNNIMEAESGDPSYGSKIGGDFDFGFQRNIGKSGLYWGMELGIGSRGFSSEDKESFPEYRDGYDMSVSMWNIKYSPFTFGYRYSVTDNLKLDGHVGIFLSYDFAHSVSYKDIDYQTGETGDDESWPWDDFADETDYKGFDAGMQIGVGAWWKRFNLDFTYQRGFVPAFCNYNGDNSYSSNFIIRLGYAF